MSRITLLLMCLAFVALVAMFVLAFVNHGEAPERLLQPGSILATQEGLHKAIADDNHASGSTPTMFR